MAYQYHNFGLSTLDGALTDSATSVDVVNAASFPTSGDFVINVEGELMLVTAVASNTFTVTRGAESTAAVSHPTGATVKNVLTADMIGTIGPSDTGWHYIGGSGEPTFQNSWVNYGTAWGAAAFRRIGDIVQLSGLIRSGTATSLIFTLPTGYRLSPTTDGSKRIFAVIGNVAMARIDVGSDGTVNGNPANATWTALDSIMYFTDDAFPE
jgi:hypothetical protein